MTEPLEEAKFVEKFLRKVSYGTDFTPDIWIERNVERLGADSGATQARSYSAKRVGIQINSLTELLKDDLDQCFRENNFVFRFVAAIAGSGKTTLLSYLQELIEVDNENRRIIVVKSTIPAKTGELTNIQNFHIKFYSLVLSKTLWQLLREREIKVVAECALRELFDQESLDELISAKDSWISFSKKFNSFIGTGINLEEVFLNLISRVLEIDPEYAFVYLIDELDDVLQGGSPQSRLSQVQQVREVFKSLHNSICDARKFNGKVRLLVYVAGTSEKMKELTDSDSAIVRRFRDNTIKLGLGVNSEFVKLREKIDKRLEGAYRGCDAFDEARAKIQGIDNQLKPMYFGKSKSIGNYCSDYAYAALEIYEEYFSDKTEKHFEGSAKKLKELLSSVCRDLWRQYLESNQGYEISIGKISENPNDHIFMCYATLRKDDNIVARAYGGFRNYEVTIDYVEAFIKQWDKKCSELSYRQIDLQNNPSDIAFLVSLEKASFLIEKKLELKKIRLIDLSNPTRSDSTPEDYTNQGNDPQNGSVPNFHSSVDVNLASEEALLRVFAGTIVKSRVGKIITGRPYKTLRSNDEALGELFKIDGIGTKSQEVIRNKLASHEICFRISAFISYNHQDKVEVNKIVAKLQERKILCWTDEQLPGGTDVRRELEEIIKSDKLWAAVIFYGKNGTGRWQDEEISSVFRRYVHRKDPVIPVVLKTCTGEPQISVFLENLKSIDFRQNKPDPLDLLIRSIQCGVG